MFNHDAPMTLAAEKDGLSSSSEMMDGGLSHQKPGQVEDFDQCSITMHPTCWLPKRKAFLLPGR
jgi:hypothetical protein